MMIAQILAISLVCTSFSRASSLLPHHSSPSSALRVRRTWFRDQSHSQYNQSCHKAVETSTNEGEYGMDEGAYNRSGGGRKVGDDDGDDEAENPELVCDAEALLACWHYLQKRKRLGKWSGEEERKYQASLSKGFFLWDDLYDELSQSKTDTGRENSTSSSRDSRRETIDRGIVNNSMQDINPTHPKMSIFENTERDQRGAQFTTYPSGPSERFVSRSKTIKKCWEDPAFREHWYERRWGKKKRKELQDASRRRMLRRQKAERRARALPSEFLGSEELASMTEEEIAFAIRELVQSNQKRIVNIKATKQAQRKRVVESDPMLADTINMVREGDETKSDRSKVSDVPLIQMDESDLYERQRQRSEVAKRIYSARLKNDKAANKKAKEENLAEVSKRLQQRPPRFPPKDMSPLSAKLRVEHALDLGEWPVLDDVQTLLHSKVKGLRKILQRIIRDCFGLRGKCIPQEDGELGFLTHSTIENLGRFVIVKLQSSFIEKEAEDV